MKHLATINNISHTDLPPPPYLVFDKNEIQQLRQSFCSQHHLDQNLKLVIIHPGHGGSANNLSAHKYAELAEAIGNTSLHIIITAGPGEIDIAQQISKLISKASHSIYESTSGLVNFAKFIAICDLFISGSTGPLHIAGALDTCTAAFYPNRRSATALRWKTTNKPAHQLAFTARAGDDMDTVDINEASIAILQLLHQAEMQGHGAGTH